MSSAPPCRLYSAQLPSAERVLCPMRSPWIGSLALLAPTRGFLVHHPVSAAATGGAGGGGARSSSTHMLQTFVRPLGTAGGTGSRHNAVWRLHSRVPIARALSMKGGGGGGGGGAGGAKEKKGKKPDSYYKHTVILPQTEFQQVGD